MDVISLLLRGAILRLCSLKMSGKVWKFDRDWGVATRHWAVLQSCAIADVQSRMFFSPPENDSFRKDLCFSPDVFLFYFFLQHEISEMRGPTGVKFCTMVSNRHYFIMPVQNFGGYTPKKISGAKNMQNLSLFRTTSKFGANISETDEDIQNRIVIPSMAIRPALGETSTVKFGPVTFEI